MTDCEHLRIEARDTHTVRQSIDQDPITRDVLICGVLERLTPAERLKRRLAVGITPAPHQLCTMGPGEPRKSCPLR